MREDFEEDDVEVWPEHHAAFNIFSKLHTQWRVDMGKKTGLDYGALYPLLDRAKSDDWQQLFDDVRTMEIAALKAINEK